MDSQNSGDYRDWLASARTGEIMKAVDNMARFHRISWKEAFSRIASPALRLHRYRNAHSRLQQDKLGALDCAEKRRP